MIPEEILENELNEIGFSINDKLESSEEAQRVREAVIRAMRRYAQKQRDICSKVFEERARIDNIEFWTIKYISNMIKNAPEP